VALAGALNLRAVEGSLESGPSETAETRR
jgi:hypothetical protein